MTHEGWLFVQLAVIGLFGALWSLVGVTLLRPYGSARLANVGLAATGLAALLGLIYFVWGLTR